MSAATIDRRLSGDRKRLRLKGKRGRSRVRCCSRRSRSGPGQDGTRRGWGSWRSIPSVTTTARSALRELLCAHDGPISPAVFLRGLADHLHSVAAEKQERRLSRGGEQLVGCAPDGRLFPLRHRTRAVAAQRHLCDAAAAGHFFDPHQKLVSKQRIDAKMIERYDTADTTNYRMLADRAYAVMPEDRKVCGVALTAGTPMVRQSDPASVMTASSPAAYCVRNRFLSNFPTLVFGTSPTKAQWSGSCHFAKLPDRNLRSSSGSASKSA